MPMKTRKIGLFVVFTLPMTLWFAWGWYVTNQFSETIEVGESIQHAMAMRGQFGDMFGGINALFTALLLAGAIYTIWIQQQQIKTIQAEQAASENDRNRSAKLMAMTALINAKGILLSTRRAAALGNNSILESKPNVLEPAFRANLEQMIYETAQKAGNDFIGLDNLAKDLEQIIEDAKEEIR
jgi:hypothetical protein